MDVDAIFDMLFALVHSGFGWRLVFSRRYRVALLQGRVSQGHMYSIGEFFGAILGLVLSLLFLAFLVRESGWVTR